MSPRTSRPPAAFWAAVLSLAVVLLGCGPTGTSTGGPASNGPVGSGSAACPTAPAVADDLPGWGPPAQVPSVVPVLINLPGQLVCGQNRVLFGLIDDANVPVGGPNLSMSIAFYELGRDPAKPTASVDATFIWAVKDVKGIYVANVSFAEAGRYGAEVTTTKPGAQPATVRLTFDVQASTPIIRVGDKAPASKTPTLDQVGGDPSRISTDTHPDPAFYKTSIDQALARKDPFVVVFATPKFCKTAQCGPTLDSIKPYVAKYPSVTFINVEPYKLKLVGGTLEADLDASNQLQATATTEQWHLVSEPAVYVVNRSGVVTASFDLIFSDAELTAALDAVK